MKRKVVSFMLIAALMVSTLVGCSSGASSTAASAANSTAESQAASDVKAATKDVKGVKIGISVLTMSGQFFIDMVAAAQQAATDNGVELMVNDAQNKSETQIAALENFISAGCKGIIVTAVDPKAIMPVIKQARAQGIAVVCHTSKLSEYDAYVGADEHTLGYTLGTAAGKYIAEKWGTKDKIEAATLNYDLLESVIQRKKGIMDGVKKYAPNVEFVADATAADQSQGMQATENFLQSHPNLRIVLGVSDGAALGAFEAFKANQMTDPSKYIVGGIDATTEALKKIRDKTIYQFTVDQAPKTAGKKVLETCLSIIKGEKVQKDYLQDLIGVSSENIANYK